MMGIILSYFFIYSSASIIEWKVADNLLRERLLSILLIAWFLLITFNGENLHSYERLFLSCVFSLWLIKICARGFRSDFKRIKLKHFNEFIFRFIWPGMSESAFLKKEAAKDIDGVLFVKGYISFILGVVLLVIFASVHYHLKSDWIIGFLGLIPLFMIIHFGYATILTSLLRLTNIPVKLLFDSPFLSASLHDFWSRRWNRPFVEMNRKLFYSAFSNKFSRPYAVLFTFVISGLLHELGISYPAGSGWGLPTIYFIIHGSLVLIEDKYKIALANSHIIIRKLWVWLSILIPLPLLFHEGFRNSIIIPLYRSLGVLIHSFSLNFYFETLLTLAGFGHFLVLVAAIQVPVRLGWKEDLAKLTTFNRKVMWNYAFFIFMMINAFGILTLMFKSDIVSGAPSALGIAALIGCFWSLRIIVDCIYFSHSDWPKGPVFVVGHSLLNSLFIFLALTNFSILGWHLWIKI